VGRDQRSTARWLVLGCTLVVFAVLMVFQTLPASVGQPLMYGVQTVTVVLACLAMLRRGRRSSGRLRRARLLVAASLLCGATGGVLAVVLPLFTALRRHGLTGAHLCIEVTETGFLAGLSRSAVSSASNCRWVSSSVGDSGGTVGRRT